MIFLIKVMRGVIPKLCAVVLTVAISGAWGEGLCSRGLTYWHRESGKCLPCTRCEPMHLAVKIPCEIHRDTICQPLHEVRIWSHKAPDLSDYEYYEEVDYSEVTNSDYVKWDLQTSSLTLAASGCVVFFLVVLVLALYHAKQWKVFKQALKSDVRDLTAKLKLMESGGDAPAEPVITTDHHIYCNIHVGKEALLGPPMATKGMGNVYTQEQHPT